MAAATPHAGSPADLLATVVLAEARIVLDWCCDLGLHLMSLNLTQVILVLFQVSPVCWSATFRVLVMIVGKQVVAV